MFFCGDCRAVLDLSSKDNLFLPPSFSGFRVNKGEHTQRGRGRGRRKCIHLWATFQDEEPCGAVSAASQRSASTYPARLHGEGVAGPSRQDQLAWKPQPCGFQVILRVKRTRRHMLCGAGQLGDNGRSSVATSHQLRGTPTGSPIAMREKVSAQHLRCSGVILSTAALKSRSFANRLLNSISMHLLCST